MLDAWNFFWKIGFNSQIFISWGYFIMKYKAHADYVNKYVSKPTKV